VDDTNGDIRYDSPERLANLRGHRQLGKSESYAADKADLWAVGVTLLELYLNQYPFEQGSASEKLAKWTPDYFKDMLAQISVIKQSAPDSLWAVIKGLLEPDPDHRLSVKAALAMPVFQRVDYQFSSDKSQHDNFNYLKALLKQTESNVVPSLAQSHVPKDQDENYTRGLSTYAKVTAQDNAQIKQTAVYTNRVPSQAFFQPVATIPLNTQIGTNLKSDVNSNTPQYN
jgi:serine/threonine protein kinase